MAHPIRGLSDVAVAFAGAALAGSLVAACGSKSSSAPDAGATVATAASASASASARKPPPAPSGSASAGPSAFARDGGAGSDAGPDFAAGECPDFDPSRWTPYEGWEAKAGCWMFTPASKDAMPRPLTWEPCEREEFGPKCRRIHLAKRERLIFANEETRAAITRRGVPTKIEIVRECDGTKSSLHSISELDGPTRVAMANDPEWPCQLSANARPEGYELEAMSWIPDEEGRVDEWGNPAKTSVTLPRLLLPNDSVTPKAIGERVLTDFRPIASKYYSKQSDVVMKALRLPPKVWPSTLTDGTDLVWTRPDPDDPLRCLVLQAPWSEDPATLAAPTRVTSVACKDLKGSKMQIGCGYFGATTAEGEVVVVRLKDGASFRFPKLCAPLDEAFQCPSRALGFSCSDAFFGVGGPSPNVFRVPLASMPGAIPPKEPPRPFDDPDAGVPASGDGGPTDAGTSDAAPTPR